MARACPTMVTAATRQGQQTYIGKSHPVNGGSWRGPLDKEEGMLGYYDRNPAALDIYNQSACSVSDNCQTTD